MRQHDFGGEQAWRVNCRTQFGKFLDCYGLSCCKIIACVLQSAGEASVANLDRLRYADGGTKTADLRLDLQKTMQEHAAVFRTGDVLQEGWNKVAALNEKMSDLKVSQLPPGLNVYSIRLYLSSIKHYKFIEC